MFQYVVKIQQVAGHYCCGPGAILEQDAARAARFDGYQEAVRHLASVLCQGRGGLSDPVTITVEPTLESLRQRKWTPQEILNREA
jgi:hypothetical protein